MTELVSFDPERLLEKLSLTKEEEEQLEDYRRIVLAEAQSLRNGPQALTHDIVLTEQKSYGNLTLKVALLDREKGRVLETNISRDTAKKLLERLGQYLQAAELEGQAKKIWEKLHPYRGF